jgi:enamidase
METSLLGGTTTMLSATTFTTGMILDADFLTKMAILAERKYRFGRPGGYLKLHAGTVVLASGMQEKHFKEMAENGVHLLSEIGCMGLAKASEIMDMIGWAKKYKMLVSAHFGGRTVVTSSRVPIDDMLQIQPDVVAHVNGGSTAASLEDTLSLIKESDFSIEVNYHGNIKILHKVMDFMKERGQLNRVVFGSDMPVGTGLEPLVIHRMLSQIASVNHIPAEDVIACATGNTADLVKANTGKIEAGREADLIIIDRPPDSVGSDALAEI